MFRFSKHVSEVLTMFNVNYPGNCFGNCDIEAKECKKCKIKQFCGKAKVSVNEDSGISYFKKLIIENYNCKVNELGEKTEVLCYDKVDNSLKLTVYFLNNGSLIINTHDKEMVVEYIVSNDKAQSLFDSCVKL